MCQGARICTVSVHPLSHVGSTLVTPTNTPHQRSRSNTQAAHDKASMHPTRAQAARQVAHRALSCGSASTLAIYIAQHVCGFAAQPSPRRSMAAAAGEQVPAVDKSEFDNKWTAWWGSLQKGQMWDIAGSAALFKQLLSSNQLQVAGKRCIVPGCGRGYDVFEFALAGAALSVGLDLAEGAVEAAKREQQHYALSPEAAVQLVQGDWFTWMPADGELFDVGYDYTFGCALHPSMRTQWAAGWARVLKPGAQLVTLIFPVDSSLDPLSGPPFPISPELYKTLLGDVGFTLLRLEQVPPEQSTPHRAGREWLAIWQR